MRGVISISTKSLAEPVKPLCAGDGIGDDVQPANNNWRGRIGFPNYRRSKIGCGLQTKTGKISRPGQNDISTRGTHGQLRQTGEALIWGEAVIYVYVVAAG